VEEVRAASHRSERALVRASAFSYGWTPVCVGGRAGLRPAGGVVPFV